MYTEAAQDYLKTIFDLTASNQSAATTTLAARLRVTPASVTGMLQRMAAANPPLVVYRKHKGVTLTAAGKKAALEVIRRHRLLETYLVKELGYGWDEVHEEACRLEHVISDDLAARIASTLGNPSRDPHGDPIPDEKLVMPDDSSIPLTDLLPLQPAVVLRVQPESAPLLRHLESLRVIPGATVTVLEYSPLDENRTIKIDSMAPIVLGASITCHIFVTLEPRS
jgi:DtxR family Mn-dependent transcriptional regulator